MDKIIKLHDTFFIENNLLDENEKQYDFANWVLLKNQDIVAQEIVTISLNLEKQNEFDQTKQTKFYESLKWGIMTLCKHFLQNKDFENYFILIKSVIKIKNTNMTFLVKLISQLITKIENFREIHLQIVTLIKDIIKVCEENNNVSLKNKMNIKLCEVYYINGEYKIGLELISTTLVDLKRYEDNLGLIELQLIESKIHYMSKGIVKAKSALTTVKTLCTKVYIEPKLQAKIDMHAGFLAAYEKDYNLAFSYFYESFDVFNLPIVKKPDQAKLALHYMILAKIMHGKLDEINNIIYGKNQKKYFDKEVEALKEVEKAVREKNVKYLGEIVMQHNDILLKDNFLKYHLKNLHDELLEKNLKKIIEPYSIVEIEFITKKIGIDTNDVLNKLSQMILDKRINGILDQGKGCLIIYEDNDSNQYLEESLNICKNLTKVVDSLYNKAKLSKLD